MRDVASEKVTVAYLFGNLHHLFVHSMDRAKEWDWHHRRHLDHFGWKIAVGTNHLTRGRNQAAEAFLTSTESDWLLFVDTDQVFEPDTVDRLVESADPDERPIVSALIMAMKDGRVTPAAAIPGADGQLHEPAEIPAERWWACIPGTGMVLIHRKVIAAVYEAHKQKADPWFANLPIPGKDGKLSLGGEDYTFFLRALALGFPAVIDTTIEAGHVKEVVLTRAHFDGGRPAVPTPFVVVPVKDNRKMTADLLRQLVEQGHGRDNIVVIDNGSAKPTADWLRTQRMATVLDGAGMGIHEMWNLGAEWCLARNPAARIAFLNNDLRIGKGFLEGLSAALDADPLMVAVCPNYDGRPGDGVEKLTGICADRYDGTGGLAGFAFMVRGEFFAGYSFPTDCKWWFGDNDLVLAIEHAGGWYGMAHAVEVEHLDGGGKTGDWSGYLDTEQGQADLAAFKARWGLVER